MPHETSRAEIADLLAVIERDLRDACAPPLSADWRFGIAYNAAVALLAAAGFRAAREAHHFRVIQSLRLTIGASSSLIAQLEALRKKRNIAGYERPGAISDVEAMTMLELARDLQKQVLTWLRQNRPELIW